MPVGLAMLLVTGSVGYVYFTRLERAFLSYMKSDAVLPVLQLHAVGHSAVHLDGCDRRALRAVDASCSPQPSSLIGHASRGGMAMGADRRLCTAFGAVCGSSVATTATFGASHACPSCKPLQIFVVGFATGTIAVGGTLGILIPPSIILVVYAISYRAEHRQAVQGGAHSGPARNAFFYCPRDRASWSAAYPEAGSGACRRCRARSAEVSDALLNVSGRYSLIALVVVGGIYGGIFTPTESAPVSAVIAMLADRRAAQGSLNWTAR